MGAVGPAVTWVKPSRCDTATCPEVRIGPADVAIRDSDRPDQIVVFSHDGWRELVDAVKDGEFDGEG
jgi:hypothetical protein